MMRTWLLVVGLLATPFWSAQSVETLRVVESHPASGESLDGRSEDFFVRFSGTVDHFKSRLFVAQSGKVLVTLTPRMNTAPNTLFARRGPLPPGDYQMSWLAYSASGQEIGGLLPFSVRADIR
jgi:methionine-rich copper-binding protein CopC